MANIYKTEGIVLKSLKYSESSVIVDIYTETKGLKSFIVSGLNSKKDRSKAACYRHLNILNIVAYDKPDGSLARIKEQQISQIYDSLTYDVVKSSIALFAIEVVRNGIKESEKNQRLYFYLRNFFVNLDKMKSGYSIVPISFLLEFSKYLGFPPINNCSELKPYLDMLQGEYVSELGEYTLDSELSSIISVIISNKESELIVKKDTRERLLDELIKYYHIHIEQFKPLKTIEVLRSIF